MSQLATGNEQQRIIAAHTLSHLLETEEAKYRALVGDPHANPNLRAHYTIGKVLAVLKVRVLGVDHASHAGPCCGTCWGRTLGHVAQPMEQCSAAAAVLRRSRQQPC